MAKYTKTAWHAGRLITRNDMEKIEDQFEMITPGATNVAENYKSFETYSKGDYCLYDGELWKCIATPVGTDEERKPKDSSAYWTKTKIMNETNSGISQSIANEYKENQNYEIGDYVTYNTDLYRCIETTHGAWNSQKWELVILSNDITDLISVQNQQPDNDVNKIWIKKTGDSEVTLLTKDDIEENYCKTDTIAPTFSASTTYTAGDYVYYDGALYCFTTDHAAGAWIGTDAMAAVIGEDISGLKSAFDFNGLGVNIFKLGSDVLPTFEKNGLTIIRVTDNKISVHGTCNTAFNFNIASKAYSVTGGATGHYMVKTSYATYGTNVHVYVGWFTSAGVANNGKRIGVANQYVDVTYAAEAAKSRDYIHFDAGASFSNVVFEFINTYEYPLDGTISEIKENVRTAQNIADTALYTDINDYDGISLGWEIGGIINTTGNNDNRSTSRLRTEKFIVGRGSEIITDLHIGAYLYFYNSDGSYNQSGYAIIATSKKYTFETEAIVRMTIRKSDYSVFSDAELATYPAYLTVNRTIPQTFFSKQYVTEEEFKAAFDGDVNIPGYFSTNLESAIESARDNITACGIDGESFFMLSDLHWENNSKHSGALIAKANGKLNAGKIICCGDVINGTTKANAVDNMASAINSYKNITRFYCLLGNHDLNGIGTTAQDQLTRDEAYALINKESDFVMQYGEPCYYYFDNPTTKTRYICLDTGTNGDLGTDQNAWLTNVLSDTPENWHILIFAHLLYTADSWQAGLQPSDLYMTTYFTDLCTQFDAYNASDNGKTIEAIFGGHTHIDANFSTTGGIPIVLIDTDSRDTYSSAGGAANTINEQCIDIVTIKYKGTNNQGSIKCARIGRGSNRVINY